MYKKIMKSNGKKSNGRFNSTSIARASTLFAAVFLSVFSSTTLANRPAMNEPDTTASTAANETSSKSKTTDLQPRPTTTEAETDANTPSAVEVMMQQQNQQPYQATGSLQLPAKEMQPGETLRIQLVDFPRRGMSMERVQQEYGQPLTASESVGQPPITHWTYNDRVVYFEYSTVLHVVAR
ncbi:hypothetical protein MNBD_GAMMA06-95 [hydrothermal vent metagenome]|uniref:Uncharacterized protein n=1 Tax=hydrothermal vent metagenome TaxID=652676 RepID=A0A3B0WGX5_9ZZZZ